MESTFRRIPHSAGNRVQITTIAEEMIAWNQRRTDTPFSFRRSTPLDSMY